MRVVIKEPGKRAYITDMEDTLKNLQDAVGGLIEYYAPSPGKAWSRNIRFVINEEGKLLGLKANIFVPYDILCGPIVALGVNVCENVGLSEAEAKFICKWLDNRGGVLK